MLVNLCKKQQYALKVIKTALLTAGIVYDSVRVSANHWTDAQVRHERYVIVIAAPCREAVLLVVGCTLVSAVTLALIAIKQRNAGVNRR